MDWEMIFIRLGREDDWQWQSFRAVQAAGGLKISNCGLAGSVQLKSKIAPGGPGALPRRARDPELVERARAAGVGIEIAWMPRRGLRGPPMSAGRIMGEIAFNCNDPAKRVPWFFRLPLPQSPTRPNP